LTEGKIGFWQQTNQSVNVIVNDILEEIVVKDDSILK
jgi:hypothetical protein